MRQDPASLLYQNDEDPVILMLEMLRLLEIGYGPVEISTAFALESETQLRDLLARVKAEGTPMLALRRAAAAARAENGFWGEDTMGRICAVAIQIFYERGYHGATLRDIADAVGIRAPSIYNHFPTKESLLYHVMTETLIRLHAQVESALADLPDDPVARMRSFIREHIRFHIDHAPEAAVADNEIRALGQENRSSVVALRDRYESILRAVLRMGIERGVFAETEIRLTSIAILTMCTAVATWYRRGGELSPEDIAATYTRFVLRMIGVEAA